MVKKKEGADWPHWDYTAPDKKKYRVFEDGRVELVIRRKEKGHGHK